MWEGEVSKMKLWRYGRPIERLGRRYSLESMLGSGDMADVCLAWDEREEHEVAIKVLKTEHLDRKGVDCFLKATERVAQWQHPNIIHIYHDLKLELIDAVQGSMVYYLVIEHAQGGSLQQRLRPGEPYPFVEMLRIFEQLCQAIAYTHKQGLLHCDLKPSNVLFRTLPSGPQPSGFQPRRVAPLATGNDPRARAGEGISDRSAGTTRAANPRKEVQEQVVLSDVGLAVEMDALQHPFVHGGSLSYLAPEQLLGRAQPASDIFALGVILYQLYTGEFPFKRTLKDVGRAQPYKRPLRPTVLDVRLPSWLDDILLKVLEGEPDERYSTADELWLAIRAAIPPVYITPSFPPATDRRASSPPRAALKDHLADQAASHIVGADDARLLASSLGTSTGIGGATRGSQGTPERRREGGTVFHHPGASNQLDVIDPLSNIVIPNTVPADNYQAMLADVTQDPLAHRSLDDIRATAMSQEEPSTDGRSSSLADTMSSRSSSKGATREHEAEGWNGPPTHPVRRIRKRWRLGWLWGSIVLLALLILTGGGLVYLNQGNYHLSWSPTPQAVTVSIEPDGRLIAKSYTFIAVPGQPDPTRQQLSLRAISAQSQVQSRIVQATGHTQVPASSATGQLTFTNDALLGQTVPAGTVITASNGVQVVLDADTYVTPSNLSSKSSTASAHALHAGANGNIPTLSINGNCCVTDGSIVVRNSAAFSSGLDAKSYAFLLPGDVERAIKAMQEPLIRQAQTQLKAQLLPGEQLAQEAQCLPQFRTDEPIGDHGVNIDSATTTLSVTCTGQAYDQREVQALVTHLLQNQAETEMGAGYTLIGTVGMHVKIRPVTDNANAPNTQFELLVDANGHWSYQFSDTRRQELAHLLAGKHIGDAQFLLLHQNGIKGATLPSGQGLLPTDPALIHIAVQPAPGG